LVNIASEPALGVGFAVAGAKALVILRRDGTTNLSRSAVEVVP
jgi:hypothetical protein